MPVQRGRMTTRVKAAVRERDGQQCADCGFEPGPSDDNLHVHRLVPGSKYEVGGCVTLCPLCHSRRHHPGKGRRLVTRFTGPAGGGEFVALRSVKEVRVDLSIRQGEEWKHVEFTMSFGALQKLSRFCNEAVEEFGKRPGRPRKDGRPRQLTA